MHQLQNDKYKKARGGKSKLLDIRCAKCTAHVALYQKDGPGSLKRMYADRFIDMRPSGEALRCQACDNLLATSMTYKKENRLAYRLVLGATTKKITP